MSTADQQPSPGLLTSVLRSLSVRKAGQDTVQTSSAPPPTIQEVSEDPPAPEHAPAPAVAQPADPATTTPAPEGNKAVDTAPAPPHKEKRDSSGYLGRLKSLASGKKDKKPETTTATKSQPKDDSAVVEIAPGLVPDAPEAELAELAAVAEEYANVSGSSTPISVPPTEPSTLAKLIQTLIDALPPLSPNDPIPKSKPVRKGSDGKPIPPSGVTQIKDPKVIAQLNSASVMNGSPKAGKKSVWSVLENLGPPKHENEGDPGSGGDTGHNEGSDVHYSPNIMLYAPLIPTNDSVVEIAMSELRPEKPKDGIKAAEQKLGPFGFPWSSKPKPEPPTKLVQIWVPSKTKLSVETKWWGYRLYLPPPVIAALGEKEIEATKVAALITAALSWILDNLPISMVPLPLQPAVLILKRLAPYLAYIGAFIAWSWSAISSFDKGYGVILSATWVLPIALIPGTWPAPTPGDQVPAPAPAPSPAPAPPTAPPATSPAAPSTPAAPPATSPAAPSTPAVPPSTTPAATPSTPAAPTTPAPPATAPTAPADPTAPAVPSKSTTPPSHSPSKPVGFMHNLFRAKGAKGAGAGAGAGAGH